STGGGEVARYIGRHGTKRVAKAVIVDGIPPLMLKTAANPGGMPIEAFDQIRAGVLTDRSQFFKDLTAPFYGANRPGSKVSQGLRDWFWLQGMQCGFKGAFDCIKVFSETDHTEDLKRFDVPTLIIHGDDDQIVPIGATMNRLHALMKKGNLMAGNQALSVVLVHGGFVDGAGWEGVYKILKRDGYNVSIVQNPTLSLADDVAATRLIIAAHDRPVIL